MSTTQGAKDIRQHYMVDPYGEFVRSEGVPVLEDYSVDCLTVPLEPWPRLGGRGAYVHLTGRGDFCSVYIAELPPGGQLNPEQHFHDEIIYVLAGRGATTLELPGGGAHTFEWGAGALFAIPLNAPHQHFNGSGSQPARFAAITNLPIYLNLTHNLDFIFRNPMQFPDRVRDPRYLQGHGELLRVRPGRHQWETCLVSDLTTLQLSPWLERGAGGNNINFILAESAVQGHISEFPSGTYKKAHRHNAGAHIWCVSGHGYSLLWKAGEDPTSTKRVDWRPGALFAPPDGPTYHQHFNTAAHPARYLALYLDGTRYPVLDSNRRAADRTDVSVKLGGDQIEYEDEDPRIPELFEAECARQGVRPHMREFSQ
jgi:quercetin dioxygenase-like cupin family protein